MSITSFHGDDADPSKQATWLFGRTVIPSKSIHHKAFCRSRPNRVVQTLDSESLPTSIRENPNSTQPANSYFSEVKTDAEA